MSIELHSSEKAVNFKDKYMLARCLVYNKVLSLFRQYHSLVFKKLLLKIAVFFKHITYTYLLLAECEVRMASYGPSFFLPFMAQVRSVRAMKTRKEKTRIYNLSYGLSK